MSDRILEGMAHLTERLLETAATAVSYDDLSNEDFLELDAVVGRSPGDLAASGLDGLVETSDAQDFLVRVSDLARGGVPITPERGHRIRMLIDGAVAVFEVQFPSGSDKAASRVNRETAWMIHTKRIDTEIDS